MQVQWVVPGEQLSFPSGHALRAFYLCFLLTESELTGRYLPLAPSPFYLFPWAAAVGFSRIAKGRHFPLDVAFGAAIGIGLGVYVPNHPRNKLALWGKTLGGSTIAVQWSLYLLWHETRQPRALLPLRFDWNPNAGTSHCARTCMFQGMCDSD